MALCSLTKFEIKKPWTNIPWLRGFDILFLQTSKQIYKKLWYTEKVSTKFQTLSYFSRKMVLYSLTKFCVFESCTNIQLLKSLVQAFDRLQSRFIVNSNIEINSSQSYKVCFAFPKKQFCILPATFGILRLVQTFNSSEVSI